MIIGRPPIKAKSQWRARLAQKWQRATPRRHFTTYEADGLRYWHTWRQWFGHVSGETRFAVGPATDFAEMSS